MDIVDVQCHRKLRTFSETRSLWKQQSALSLLQADARLHQNFCRAVTSFHNVGRFQTHPGIQFANISVLQLNIFPGHSKLVQKFETVFSLLNIQDLCLECSEDPSFMETSLQVWAPVLQNLRILRIHFNRFRAEDVSG